MAFLPDHSIVVSRQMAPLIDTDAIPGTFTLVDSDHVVARRHLDGGNSDIVLVPEPSNDPDDPLNWSPRRKLLSTVCVSTWDNLAYVRTQF